MTEPQIPLLMSRCVECHNLFLPRRSPCPRCGSKTVTPAAVSPEGRVVAATELSNPPTGWTAPHRIALVELIESLRVLVVVRGPLPATGSSVTVVHEGELFTVVTPGT